MEMSLPAQVKTGAIKAGGSIYVIDNRDPRSIAIANINAVYQPSPRWLVLFQSSS
jgi:hypothetical protein